MLSRLQQAPERLLTAFAAAADRPASADAHRRGRGRHGSGHHQLVKQARAAVRRQP